MSSSCQPATRCCCFPIRSGVYILASLTIVSAIISIWMGYEMSTLDTVVMVIDIIFAVVGLFAAMKLNLMAAKLYMGWNALYMVLGGVLLIVLMVNRDTEIAACVSDCEEWRAANPPPPGYDWESSCNDACDSAFRMTTLSMFFSMFLSAYLVYILWSFTKLIAEGAYTRGRQIPSNVVVVQSSAPHYAEQGQPQYGQPVQGQGGYVVYAQP